MTYRKDFTLPAELLERVSKQGFDILPELIQVIINTAMQAERQQYLKAEHYQHSEEREGHANGYKPKTDLIRVPIARLRPQPVGDGLHRDCSVLYEEDGCRKLIFPASAEKYLVSHALICSGSLTFAIGWSK